MNRYQITWPDESTEDGETPLSEEGFVNERFGSAYEPFVDRGGKLAFMEAQEISDSDVGGLDKVLADGSNDAGGGAT